MPNSQSNIFNPFPGLRPFGIEEDYLFFGREQQTSELVTLLREQRFIAVTGTSGSGKSSLVRAGLLPELQGGMMKEVGSDWEMVVLRPGGAPLRHLAESIAEADMCDPEDPEVIGDLVATLSHSGMGLVEAIRQSHMEPDTNILVLVDQFEEIFRFRRSGAANEEQASSFVNLLLEAGAQREIPIYVIITMRSDYLGDCTEFRGLTEAVNEGEYLIPRLTRDQIRSCIEGPIQVGGGQVAFSLTQELLNSVGNDQDQLPVLQHALMRTFDRWVEDHGEEEPLELRHYHDVGGMEEALLRHADEVYHSLDEVTREVAQGVFQALTERGVDNRGIRRPTRLDQLTKIVGADLDQVKEVVEAYRNPGVTFLMPPSEVPLEPDTIIDISHESLMRVWSRLEDWVDAEAQSARIYRRLAETAGLYGQQRAGLYHDPDLQIALSWRESAGPTAAWAERYAAGFQTAMSFLDESDMAGRAAEREREAARQRELEQAQALAAAETQRATLQQRSARRMRYLSGGVAVIAVAALVAFVFALSAQREAARQEANARQNATKAADNAQKARAAQQVAQQNESKARSAAMETQKQATAARAAEKLAQENAVAAQQSAAEAVRQQELAQAAQGEAETAAVALNATLTQSQFVTANENLEADKIDQTLAYLARSLRTDPTYWQAAAQIVSLLSERSFPIAPPQVVAMQEPIQYWSLDADKKQAWTLGLSGKGALWDTSTGKLIGELAGGQQADWPAFTADGSRLYVSLREQGGSVVGLSTETGEAVTPVMAVQNRLDQVFSVGSKVDGQIRVLLDDPQTRQLLFWDGETGQPITLPRVAQVPVQKGTYGFSPDHRYAYAAYADKTVSVWNSGDGSPVVAAGAHGLSVAGIDMTPDSKWIVMASQVDQAIAWLPVATKENAKENAKENKVQRVDVGFPLKNFYFHPQKPLVLVVGRTVEAGQVKVVNLETAEIVTSITQEELSGSNNRAMDAFKFLGRRRRVQSLGLSRVLGRWLLGMVSHERRQFGVWDLASGKEIRRFHFEDSPLQSIGFTSDGGRVYSTHDDNSLRIWDLFSGRPLAEPIEHPWVPGVEVTDDGEKLITTNVGDMSVRVYSSRNGELLVEPRPAPDVFSNNFEQLKDRNQIINGAVMFVGIDGVMQQTEGRLVRWSSQPRSGRVLEHEMNGLTVGEFSPDGKQVVIGSQGDSMAKIWDLESGKIVYSFRQVSGVSQARFSPDGKRLLTGSPDQMLRIWDLNTGKLSLEIDGERAANARFNSQGNRIVVSSPQGAVGIWDAESGFPLFGPVPMGGSGEFLPDGRRVLVASRDGAVRVIDSETGQVQTLEDRHNSGLRGVTISPQGTHFVTSAFSDTVRVWDAETLKPVLTLDKVEDYLATAFHPGGDLFAVNIAANAKWQVGTIEVRNWRTGKRVLEPLQCEGQIYGTALQFSADGRFLAGGTVDGLLSLWETTTGKRMFRGRVHAKQISSLAFSPDSRRLLSTSADGRAYVIDLPPVDDAIPTWLADLAEVVAGKRISDTGALEDVDRAGLAALQQRIAAAPQENSYTQWAQWFLADPAERRAAPDVNLSMRDYLEIRSRGQTLREQYDAFQYDPNNGLISCRIGYLLATSPRRKNLDPHVRPHWDAMALWYGEQGTELSPEVGEAWALRAAVQQIVGVPAHEAIARALELDTENPIGLFVQAFQLESDGKSAEAYQAFSKSVELLPENRYALDWNNEKPFLIGTLRRILNQEKRNPLTLAQAGRGRLLESTDTVQRRRVEAEWLTRLASELAPEDSQVWRLRGQVLASLERHDEAFASLQKSAELDPQGRPNWHQLGQLARAYSEQLIGLKLDKEADDYLLQYGIPPRDDKATADQVDLSEYYNHTLFEDPYRTKDDKSDGAWIWRSLPIGLVPFNDILFDVRGIIRLSGQAAAGAVFSRPLPVEVKGIAINRQATWIHFLHTVVAQRKVQEGEEVGYYQIHYADGETRRLPIRYGRDVVIMVDNEFAVATHGALAWDEGMYQSHKSLCHSTWENPRPEVTITAVDFVSTNSVPAPLLMAVTLESDEKASERDPQTLSQRALHRAVYTQGQTELTQSAVERDSALALEAEPANETIMYRRAEVLLATGKTEESLTLVKRLRSEHPEHPGYRLLHGRIEWQLGNQEAAAETLRLPVGKVAVNQVLTRTDEVMQERLHRAIFKTLGPVKGRAFVVAMHVPPRDPDLPPEVVDLTRYYNASLTESWYSHMNGWGPFGDLYGSLRPGRQVIQGVTFDIRGIAQINDGTQFVMKIPYPPQIEAIEVGVKGNQIHFLHGAVNNAQANAPAALYRIHMEDGTTHEYIARWQRDLAFPWANRDATPNTNIAWRAERVTAFRNATDAVLHFSTWTNPTPDVQITRVDFVVTGGKPQPFLAAMTVESFEQQLASDPGDARRLSELALYKSEMRQGGSRELFQYIVQLLTKAEADAPTDAVIQRHKAEIALRLGDANTALAAIDKAIELDDTASLSWETRGRVLAKLKRFSEARQAKTKTRAAQLLERIPDRAESTPQQLIDLSQHYNAALTENPFETFRKLRALNETFTTMPRGVATVGGVRFDLRGIVALQGKQTQLRPMRANLTERAEGIQVGQAAKTLQFLHGTGWGHAPHGTVIGKIVVHYQDGETAEIPIRTGVHVRDWFLNAQDRRQVSDGKLVWVHSSPELSHRDIGVYLMTWENPRPDQVIQSLDYVSTMTDSAPFLLGVTLEGDPAGGE